MMKKLIMLLTICMMCLLAVSASAAEKNDEAPPINWEISMMPKPTAEEIEAARWSIVLENTMGVMHMTWIHCISQKKKTGL